MLKINDAELDEAPRQVLRYAAVAVFLIMAISDGLDGFLARKKGQSTKLGAFLDPTADKLLMTSACLLLASHRGGVPGFLLPTTVVVLIIGKDILLFAGFLILFFLTGNIRVVPAIPGKVSTALQLSMVAATLIAPEVASVFPGWIWFLRILWWSAATAAMVAVLVYIRIGSKFIEQYEQSNGH
jgi:phosphatidylglycerophosphate synthase